MQLLYESVMDNKQLTNKGQKMIYRGYDIEETPFGVSIYLKMPSGDMRFIKEVDTLEEAEEVVDEEQRILKSLYDLQKKRKKKLN